MFTKTAVVLALVAVALAAPSQPSYDYSPPATYESPAKYDFNYAVKDDYSGNDFGHQEARDGYNTQGSYFVLLPDGRLQKVTYTVNGDSGYVAEVSYEGEAQYPEYHPAPAYVGNEYLY
nr:cuticle protein 19-like [Penaeus vannamei]